MEVSKNQTTRARRSAATLEGKKCLKKRLHNRQTTHYKSAYEYGTPLYFTRRPSCMRFGKLAAK
jgi:hypothetical protein